MDDLHGRMVELGKFQGCGSRLVIARNIKADPRRPLQGILHGKKVQAEWCAGNICGRRELRQ